MRSFGFWVLVVVAGTVLALLALTSSSHISVPGSVFHSHEGVTTMNLGGVTAVRTNRKLKESYDLSTSRDKRDLGSVNQEDYPRFDPVPSSKAAIKAGPIEHGTPLMPYIPRPTPPGHPKHGGSP